MQLHTFSARSLSEALRLVREELGPDASVLQTREVGSTLSRWLGGRTIEVTASAEVEAPSRMTKPVSIKRVPAAELQDYRQRIRHSLFTEINTEPSIVEQLAGELRPAASIQPTGIAALQSSLHKAGVRLETSERWLQQLSAELACDPECHADRIRDRLRHIVAADLPVCGPIRLQEHGPTVVALVGPTGVGKTTTLAKLAARFRLYEQRSVAAITVDTYRIAAVEQLRTYAGIMDLPMEVVATEREMTAAIERLSQHNLILIDTAGRSPRDPARLLELRSLLTAARPHATALVLAAVADVSSQMLAAQAFAEAGATSLILTKLDEAARLGSLPDWIRPSGLPLAYTTHGQNVPDDIAPANALQLADLILTPDS